MADAASSADPGADGAGSDSEQKLVAANDTASSSSGVPVLASFTPDGVKDALQSAGYRVEVLEANGISVLRSATGGLPFDIRFLNRRPGSEDQHLDMTFVALFAVRGAFPEKLLNEWNRSRRFGRLFLDQPVPGQDFLVLGMDVVCAGGVTPPYLRAHIEIWDALVHQLVGWLRHALPTAIEPTAKDGVGPGAQAGDIPSATH